MCQSCNDIDRQIEEHRKKRRSADTSETERINKLIAELYADRVRLHKNPED